MNGGMNWKHRVKGEITTLKCRVRLDREVKTLQLEAEKLESTIESKVTSPS